MIITKRRTNRRAYTQWLPHLNFGSEKYQRLSQTIYNILFYSIYECFRWIMTKKFWENSWENSKIFPWLFELNYVLSRPQLVTKRSKIYQRSISRWSFHEFFWNLSHKRQKCHSDICQVFEYTIHLLQEMSKPEYVEITMMNQDNLCMVFAPAFLKCPHMDYSKVSYMSLWRVMAWHWYYF